MANQIQWKSLDILGYPNYKVSNTGLIRNIKSGYSTTGSATGGYYRASLDSSKQIMIHVLIAKVFLGIPDDTGLTVDHINRDGFDNRVENLRWATRREQALNKGKVIKKRGNKPVTQMDINRNEIFTWFKIRDAASYLGITPCNFSKVCENGGTLGGFKWKYCSNDIEGEIWQNYNDDTIEPILISNFGRYKRLNTGKIGYGSTTVHGYKMLSLYKSGKKICIFMHRLVVQTFIGHSEKFVNHKDGNKQNNKIDNLEYLTSAENSAHAVNNNLRVYKTRGQSKIARAVYQILNGVVINTFTSMEEASKETKISKGNICSVCKGDRPRAGGYQWKYVEEREIG